MPTHRTQNHQLAGESIALLLLVRLCVGCSSLPADSVGDAAGGSADGSATGGQSSASGGQGDATGGASGGPATGGGGQSSSDDYPDVEFLFDPTKNDPTTTCAEKTISAARVPLDMYVILDRTGSMGEDCPINLNGPPAVASKWCHASNALGKYFSSDAASGHRAALQFMIPAETQATVCEAADGNLHASAKVDLTDLPSPADGALIQALEAEVPDASSTAIESALNGIVLYTSANRTPSREMIGILISDGEPSFCSESLGVLAAIPSTHFQQTGIRTFIVGMTGAESNTLEELAATAGGPAHTDFCAPDEVRPACHYWSVGDGDPEAFASALDAIQESAVGCEFTVPSTDQGLVDLDTVRVEMTSSAGGDALLLSAAEGEGSCGTDQFYRSERDGAASIRLCPETCALVTDDTVIEVTLECLGD